MELNRLLLFRRLASRKTAKAATQTGRVPAWILNNNPVFLSVRGRLGPDVVAQTPSRANEFLTQLWRPQRNIWDRSKPDRLETDLSYWMDQWRSSDQGRQHHYDENAAVGPHHASSYRHGADVNYDYY
ncbi:hypothetical protein LDENG_00183780 [Lucifuga dentata]|nr:hypothetical protein LDENG_00183780 [Lucifuga dentata]